jgi:hypothetical protein
MCLSRNQAPVQVPNEKLMQTDLLNITQSRAYQDRIFFEVDARRITQARARGARVSACCPA